MAVADGDFSDSAVRQSDLTAADHARLETLFRSGAPALYRYAMRLSGGRSTVAEDLVQEAFHQLVRQWYGPSGRDGVGCAPLRELPDDKALAWLTVTLRNKNIDRVRHEIVAAKGQELLGRQMQPGDADPVEVVTEADAAVQAIRNLPPQRRRVAWLRWGEGWTTAQIAHKLGIAESTVRNHIRAARIKLAPIVGSEADSAEGGERR